LCWLKFTDSSKHVRDKRTQVTHSIRLGDKEQDTERLAAEPLMELEVLVHREKRVEATGHASQQVAILGSSPP
jgi:hypothetical protein